MNADTDGKVSRSWMGVFPHLKVLSGKIDLILIKYFILRVYECRYMQIQLDRKV